MANPHKQQQPFNGQLTSEQINLFQQAIAQQYSPVTKLPDNQLPHP